MIELTEHGLKEVKKFLAECKAMRKEILDSWKDTCDDTTLPTMEDIIADMEWDDETDNGDYCNCWGVTDNYSSSPLFLEHGIDFTVQE